MASLLIQKILEKHSITAYLAAKGIHPDGPERNGKLFYKCPLHAGDNTPSFVVYTRSGGYENFYCFGCLEETEMIWTLNGLREIGSIKRGDLVYDRYGQLQQVLCEQKKIAITLGIKLGSFREELILTPNHTCVFIKRQNALDSFRRLYFDAPRERIVFRPDLANRPRRALPEFVYGDASQLVKGDYFGFPVVKSRNNTCLSNESAIKGYTKGPKVKRIDCLKYEGDGAWLCGLYLAEGSSSGRIVRLTLSIDEDEIANRAADALRSLYGVKVRVLARPERSTIEVLACNVDLAAHFANAFGKGACNKVVPGEIFHWLPETQREFINGYIDGDGNSVSGTVVSCSRAVATAIYGIAVQAGMYPSFYTPVLAKVDKNGVNHSTWYAVGFRRKEGINGFHEIIDGITYYLSPIIGIVPMGERKVVDISVTGSETFCCKNGATHNCKAKFNIIHLYRDLEKVSLGQAIARLGDGMGVTDEAELTHAVSVIQNDDSVEGRYTPDELVLQCSRLLYDFLKWVDHDADCAEAAGKMFQMIDRAALTCDLKSLQAIYEQLPDALVKKQKLYFETKEQKERGQVSA